MPLILLIKLYRLCLSPILPPACRFQPSCSDYAIEAIEKYRWRGVMMAAKRIMRCHPWGRSGFDPVPLSKDIKG